CRRPAGSAGARPAVPPFVPGPVETVTPGWRAQRPPVSLVVHPADAPAHGPAPATPLPPRLAAHRRLRPAGALPRGHVLRELGLAHQPPAAGQRARALHAADLPMAAVPAVPGFRDGDGVPGG